MGGNETNGGASRVSSGGKLEVRPSGRPVSLHDVTLPEVSSLTRAQMNWQLVRRVLCRPVKRRCACGSARAVAPRCCNQSTPWARRPYCVPASRRLVGGKRVALWRAAAKYAAAAEPCLSVAAPAADPPALGAPPARRKKQVLVLNAARRFRHCAEQAALQRDVNAEVRGA
jgi:hypothetical protein